MFNNPSHKRGCFYEVGYNENMIPIIASILVPIALLTLLMPYVKKHGKREKNVRFALFIACFSYAIAWYVPSPMIDGMDTAFWTHFLGGFSVGLIWLYLVGSGVWKIPSFGMQVLSLYALVSSLGVLNELAEYVLVKMDLFSITLADTSWDLVANSLGAASFYIVYKAVLLFKK